MYGVIDCDIKYRTFAKRSGFPLDDDTIWFSKIETHERNCLMILLPKERTFLVIVISFNIAFSIPYFLLLNIKDVRMKITL